MKYINLFLLNLIVLYGINPNNIKVKEAVYVVLEDISDIEEFRGIYKGSKMDFFKLKDQDIRDILRKQGLTNEDQKSYNLNLMTQLSIFLPSLFSKIELLFKKEDETITFIFRVLDNDYKSLPPPKDRVFSKKIFFHKVQTEKLSLSFPENEGNLPELKEILINKLIDILQEKKISYEIIINIMRLIDKEWKKATRRVENFMSISVKVNIEINLYGNNKQIDNIKFIYFNKNNIPTNLSFKVEQPQEIDEEIEIYEETIRKIINKEISLVDIYGANEKYQGEKLKIKEEEIKILEELKRGQRIEEEEYNILKERFSSLLKQLNKDLLLTNRNKRESIEKENRRKEIEEELESINKELKVKIGVFNKVFKKKQEREKKEQLLTRREQLIAELSGKVIEEKKVLTKEKEEEDYIIVDIEASEGAVGGIEEDILNLQKHTGKIKELFTFEKKSN